MIRPRRSFRSRPPVRARRRKTVWAREAFTGTAIAADTLTTGLQPLSQLENQLGGDLVGATILRIVGSLTVCLTGSGNAVAEAFTCGFLVGELPPADYGATHPDPRVSSTDRMASWMLWHREYLIPNGLGSDIPVSRQWNFDTKVRRVLRQPADALQVSVAWGSSATTATVSYDLTTSILVALH